MISAIPRIKFGAVKWLIDEPPGGTLENRETLKDDKAFHHYCAANKLNAFLPRSHPLWEASMLSTQRWTAAQLKARTTPDTVIIGPGEEKKKSGKTVTKTASSMDIASGLQQGTTRGAVDPGKMRHRTKRARPHEMRQRKRVRSRGRRRRTSNSDHDGQLHHSSDTVGTSEWKGFGQGNRQRQVAQFPNTKMHKAFPPPEVLICKE